MDDTEVRLRCVEAAVKVVGNPNVVQQARSFYEFVTAESKPPVRAILVTADGEIPNPTTAQVEAATGGKKGNRK